LTAAFPEVVDAITDVPDGCVLDGELVMWLEGRLDFDALQRRASAGRRRGAQLARTLPASYVAFDLLAVVGRDIRHHPLDVRRQLLEELAPDWDATLQLSPVTRDHTTAEEWSESMAAAGIEGIVAKGGNQPYTPDRREWVKVKRRQTLDVVVGAVIGSRTRPEAVVVGRPDGQRLRIVGRSTALKAYESRTLGELLRPPRGKHPWPEVVAPGAVDRFNAGREPIHLTLVEPVVAEISADMALTNGAFRHSVRFLRLRPDLDPNGVPPLG
jgi:ATP-dependent DNA ligase